MAEPTRDQLLAIMHSNERQLCESKDAPAAQCEAIFDFYRRQWKQNHPDPPEPKSPRESIKDAMDEPPAKPGEFRDIQPSQVSPDKKPPAEFDVIKPVGTFDTRKDDPAPKPETPNKGWSSAEYRRRKAERDANRPPSEQGQLGLRKAAEKMARDSQMVSNAFQQATNSKPPELEKPAPETGFTPVDSSIGRKTPSWIHKIPVWKEFGHWLRWASASFAFAIAMVGTGEYLVAWIALIVAILCCLIQIWLWQRDTKSRTRDCLPKIGLTILAIILGGFAIVDVYYIKGRNEWTHLRVPSRWAKVADAPHQQKESTVVRTATPLPTAAPTSTLPPPFANRRQTNSKIKKQRCSAEDRLLGRC